MRTNYYILLLALTASFFSGCVDREIYKNPDISIERRTSDLLRRMTIEEKVGQLMSPYGWEMYDRQGDSVWLSDKFIESLDTKHIGMLWGTMRADPWTQRDLETGLNPTLAAKVANMIQTEAVENTRLGIPIFLAEEAPHGHMAIGATVFPTAVGQASTWNPSIIEQMGRAISTEIRTQGAHISYGPVLDIARDPRWSRVEECYGEDPVLTARMGEAFVKGLGSADLSKPNSTVSTLKHFVAYGVSEAGQNGGSNVVGMRELASIYLPPMKAAIRAGARSVMTSYNSVDGIPCTANGYLLNEILKNDWGFDGFVISDLLSIEGLYQTHNIAGSITEAAVIAMTSGVDVDLCGNAYHTLIEAVRRGDISESLIDAAVVRVLKLKFEMGLFENPFVVPHTAAEEVGSAAHAALAKRIAAESITLLENKNNALPLPRDIGKIAVIGPNADNTYNQLGDYTAQQSEVRTVLKGIVDKIGSSRVIYAKGCAIRDTSTVDIEAAVRAARSSDAAIVVVGGSSARDFKTQYMETGAAVTTAGAISDMESGEGFDRATLDLLGKQQELLKAVKAVGKPMIVIYIQGRPLHMTWASENADALICAWYPGQEGGDAIADVLLGDYNPAGRLPISVPRSVGQVPIYYNRLRPANHNYVEMSGTPLYPFGYGLSYTSFEYMGIEVSREDRYTFSVDVTIRNSGSCDGDEVVQLYLRDEVSSVVRPAIELKAFERIHLHKGEQKTVRFKLDHHDFALIDGYMNQVVEPGTFTIFAGASSNDLRLSEVIDIE